MPRLNLLTLVCLLTLFAVGCSGEAVSIENAMTTMPALEAATETPPQVTLSPDFHLPRDADEVGWLTHGRGAVESLAFSPDGRILATGHNNGDIILWEMSTGKELQLLTHPQSQSGGLDLAFNADGSLLAVAEAFVGQVTLWNVSSGEKLRSLAAEGGRGQPLTDVAFSPDGSLLVAAQSSGQSLEPAGQTFVWQTADWQQLYVLEDAAPPVVFSPNGRQLITLSGIALAAWMPDLEPALIAQWDLQSGERIDEISVDGFVVGLALSPDGKILAANVVEMGSDASIPYTALLDVASGATLHRLPAPEGVQGPDALEFRPDGSQLAVGYQPNRVVVWDTTSGEAARDLVGPADWLRHPAFSPDGTLLAGDSSDGRILFWHTGEEAAAGGVNITVQSLNGEPLLEALLQLHPTNRERLLDFIATVPDPLPNDLAHPQAVFFQPREPFSQNTLVVSRSDGYVEREAAIANPGSNDRITNVICLRNGEQTSCTPEADVWSVSLPAETLAFVPLRIPSEPGDALTILFIPDREPERYQPGSSMLLLFVEQDPPPHLEYLEAPAREKLYDGCDFAHVQSHLDANRPIQIPGAQKRGMRLYLIFQTCDPVAEELVQLVPIVDRSRVIDLPDDVWRMPVRLANPATVIEIDTQLLGDADEFQIAVVPVGESVRRVPDWWGWFPFTQAVSLID